MYMSILGIDIESYGHVLGPPKFFFNFEKNNIPATLGHFFKGLNRKIQIVIKVWLGVRFWHRDACFHTQSILFTRGTTFHVFWVAKTSHGALFS